VPSPHGEDIHGNTLRRQIQGIELAEKIKKQQFNLKLLTGKASTAPDIWAAVLSA
jgi:hypothetical protein